MKKDKEEIHKLKCKLAESHKIIQQMRLDYLKEINQLQNRVAFAHNEPGLQKKWTNFKDSKGPRLTGNRANTL